MSDSVKLAIDSVNKSKVTFCKFISANDSGETGGHQGGIYIPKNSVQILFDKPGKKGENLERFVTINWPDKTISRSRFIYYGKGTRNEYRITQLNKQLLINYLFILSKIDNENYNAFLLDEADAVLFLNKCFLTKENTNQLIKPPSDLFNDISSPIIESVPGPFTLSINKSNKLKDGTFKIRPAGRHLLTIGRDLIKDNYAAIVELVKNSYDADADRVDILFTTINNSTSQSNNEKQPDKLRIIIGDNGHGMDYETVVNKWMVPSTDDKLKRKYSPKGRTMQGRKGIGRYASSILGNELLLETCSKDKENTTLYIDWNEFENNDYLDDVPVLIETFSTSESSKTILEITGDKELLKSWSKAEIESLILELKKLKVPFGEFFITDKFDINLVFKNFPVIGYENTTIDIKPFPLPDLFDYRISGNITNTGIARLKFENNSVRGIIPEYYEFQIILKENESFCGEVFIDFKVFDREPEAIQGLIDRGLSDPETNKKLGRNEVRNLLNQLCGIGIYRNGFRIRPYGDPGYDWLLLDKIRVQNPSFRIGSNQVIGYIGIQSEELSKLDEKSARDGLKENAAFYGLLKIATICLNRLEEKRFAFRSKTGKGRSHDKTDQLVEKLFNLSDLKSEINEEFNKVSLAEDVKNKVANLIEQKELQNNAIAEELKKKIAEYQGQVTLGKIINIILHEGRKPFMYYTNHIPLLKAESQSLKSKFEQVLFESIIKKIEDIQFQSEILVDLFEKIDPLAAKRRDNKKEFCIFEAIETVRLVFESELIRYGIRFEVNCHLDIKFIGWQSDFYITITNLVENSIYWLKESKQTNKTIKIDVKMVDGCFILDYYDNGLGIDVKFIEDKLIFEPGFTTKTDGTGLGLAIAGEAMDRNNCLLKAEEAEVGVHFIIESKKINNGTN